ncbi:MAG: hypothetical protein Q4B06_00515 [Candidatus Saccharibacteria bacterium]|nr:hypothetical protein [Candidatus Saccharibacteria bacterium]
MLGDYQISDEAYDYISSRITQDEKAENVDSMSIVANLKNKIDSLNGKQKILLDSYLDQDIDRQTFLAKKSEILSEKKSLEEKLTNLTANHNAWIEPMRKWLEIAKSICNLRKIDDFSGQKVVLLEIFGSNLAMHNKTLTILNHQDKFGVGSKTAFRKGAESSFLPLARIKKYK